MKEIFGEILDSQRAEDLESLFLTFSPGLLPLQQRWRNNGLSADFLADYVTTFFPKDENDPGSAERQSSVKGTVSYIANELLENAMKYGDGRVCPITIRLTLRPECIVFDEINGTDGRGAESYRAFVREFTASDPAEAYFRRLEQVSVSGETSGLGLITMANDYAAVLGWCFEDAGEDAVVVRTQARVAI